MSVSANDRPAASSGDRLGYLIGVFGCAFSITALWLCMRAVLDIGGSCGSGGPYEIAVPCPPGVDLLLVLAFPLGFASVGLMVWKGARLGAAWVALAGLAWPAVFLSLGWNFIEYGLWPPVTGDPGLGFLIPGVVFLVMGGVPLWFWWIGRGDAPAVPGSRGTRARSDLRQLRDLRDAMAHAAVDARRRGGPTADRLTVRQAMSLPGSSDSAPPPSPAVAVAPAPDAGGEGDRSEAFVAQLERLAVLHRAGDLSLLEFQAAKAALLANAGGDPR